MIHAFLVTIGFFLSLYACFWVVRGIMHERYRWIAWPVLIALPFVGGIIGWVATGLILFMLIAWLVSLPYRSAEHNHRYEHLTEWNGQQVWFPDPDKPGSNMYVAEGQEDWERIVAKHKTARKI